LANYFFKVGRFGRGTEIMTQEKIALEQMAHGRNATMQIWTNKFFCIVALKNLKYL